MLIPWIAVYLVEIALFVSPLWLLRRWLAPVVTVLTICFGIWLGMKLVLPLQIILAVLTIFRLLNLMRVIKARMHTRYLWKMTTRSALWFAGLHVLGLWLYMLCAALFTRSALLTGLLIVQLIVGLCVWLTVMKNIRKLTFRMPKRYLTDSELPTVTVAIPARNETLDLDECLQAVLANDYPKLEVIVLDDCSQDRTADIIRGFAHAGVRFVRGDPPAERWLAKNQAYHKLYKEASGELILFIGVDVRLGKRAIRAMVNVLHARHKSMLSVLPMRDRSTPAAAFIQPMRYWWELALPRRMFNRPPVLSTCWLVKRSVLKKLGGFAAISHAVIPEGYFARELVKTDAYSFIRSSRELDVRTVKHLDAQRQTVLRVRYPQLRRRLELVLLLSVAEIGLLLLPFGLLVGARWLELGGLVWLAAGTSLALIGSHVFILGVTNPANLMLGFLNFPVVVLSELFMGYASMLQYEFFTITWRERNICIPVMHVIPKLPELKP